MHNFFISKNFQTNKTLPGEPIKTGAKIKKHQTIKFIEQSAGDQNVNYNLLLIPVHFILVLHKSL